MASIRDTHTAIFTRIPKSIHRVWTTKVINASSLQDAQGHSLHHQHSLIDEIQLHVKYNEEIVNAKHELDETDDDGHAGIELWQEVRRDWIALEKAIECEISKFVTRAVERTEKTKGGTIDALRKSRTTYDEVNNSEQTTALQSTVDMYAPVRSTREHPGNTMGRPSSHRVSHADKLVQENRPNDLYTSHRSGMRTTTDSRAQPLQYVNDQARQREKGEYYAPSEAPTTVPQYSGRRLRTIVDGDSVSQLSRRDLKYIADQVTNISSKRKEPALIRLGRQLTS